MGDSRDTVLDPSKTLRDSGIYEKKNLYINY